MKMLAWVFAVAALSGCVAVRVVHFEVYAQDEFDIAPVLRDINASAEVAP